MYRVVCEFDRRNLEPLKDEVYIRCGKGGQIYRICEDTLAYYRPSKGNGTQICNRLVEIGVRGVENRSTDGDLLIYFYEEDIDVVAEKMGAVTSGASIKPFSIKNLRLLDWFKKDKQKYTDKGFYKELSEEEKEIYRERFKSNMCAVE